jgi:predicted metal-dependent hydrolase
MKTIADVMCVNGIEFPVKIKIHRRDNTRVTIRNKSISISVPSFLPRSEIRENIEKMKEWAKKKILESPEKFKDEPIKPYLNGQEIAVGNERYYLDMEYRNSSSSSVKMKENRVILKIALNLEERERAEVIASLISKGIAKRKLPDVQKRIEELNSLHFQQKINQVTLKHNRSRWGSCSTRGNINISTRILFAPSDVMDYLLIHELAHMLEHNHSASFWALVERAMPDYREKERWLRMNRDGCAF